MECDECGKETNVLLLKMNCNGLYHCSDCRRKFFKKEEYIIGD